MSFGDVIKALRTKAGLSQKKLANALGVSQQAVARWEIDNYAPTADTLAKIADYFGVTIDYLLERSATPGQNYIDFPVGYETLTDEEKEIINNLIEKFRKDR